MEGVSYLPVSNLSRIEVEVLGGLGLEMGFLYKGKRGGSVLIQFY